VSIKSALVGVFLSSFLLLSGCGENLFSGISGSSPTTSIEGLNRQLDIADSPSDYTPIISGARNIIQDSASSSEDIKDAQIILAQAIIGQNNVPVLDMFADVFDDLNSNSLGSNSFSSQSTLGSNDVRSSAENIYQTIGAALENISSSDIRAAADAINTAFAIVSEHPIITMADDHLIVGGMINMMAIAKSVDQFLEVTTSSVTVKDDSLTIVDIIELLMNPHGFSLTSDFSNDIDNFIDSEDRDGIDQYSAKAFEMFDGTSALPSDMQTFLEEHFETTFNRVLDLYRATLTSGGTYSFEGTTYDVGTSFGSREDDILDAIEAIFRAALT